MKEEKNKMVQCKWFFFGKKSDFYLLVSSGKEREKACISRL